ncbi:hypothetical protein [Methylobacterium sp. WL120]|uniref:hypothetical protein n=1 Tax=Methylobacterium sp. WL120 TaxID=2603887 RepID=UPI0011CB845B|nr:hypothetical protein [Methylobacterium sp. WL120]TXM65751.1 hypothetical protein FV229_14755 [Methylobacterium sp. WL120]
MATSKLPALARPAFQPAKHPCHRPGCNEQWAERGFPNDVWFCTPCVPPTMRFEHEAGYVAPDQAATTAPIATPTAQAAFDLVPEIAPA